MTLVFTLRCYDMNENKLPGTVELIKEVCIVHPFRRWG